MRPRILIALAAALLAIALEGCLSIHDPDTNSQTTTHTATTTTTSGAQRAAADPVPVHERGGNIPAAARKQQSTLAPDAADSTPQAALERYAVLWCNWTAATVLARQRELASISLGQARAHALQAAASLAADSTLAKSQVANSGQLIAIAPALTDADEWVVITRERTTGQGAYQGLPATRPDRTRARAERARGAVDPWWTTSARPAGRYSPPSAPNTPPGCGGSRTAPCSRASPRTCCRLPPRSACTAQRWCRTCRTSRSSCTQSRPDPRPGC